MADYIDGSSSENAGLSRRSLIKKGMLVGGVGLWAVPVLAVVTRNGSTEGGTGVTQQMTPANHGGPPVAATCQTAGSPAACITFVCVFPFTFTECTATRGPVAPIPTNGPDVCFCDTDISGVCRCVSNADCGQLANCPDVNAPNGGCPAPTVCINPFSCCGVAKCVFPCV